MASRRCPEGPSNVEFIELSSSDSEVDACKPSNSGGVRALYLRRLSYLRHKAYCLERELESHPRDAGSGLSP